MSTDSKGVRTIICLENGTDVFGRLTQVVGNRMHAKYRVVHWTSIPAGVGDLLHELSPGVLVVTGHFLKALFMRKFRSSDQIRILAVAEPTDPAAYEAFLRNGCHGIINRDCPDEMMLKSLDSVFAGELWVPRAILSQIVRKWIGKNQSRLTSREAEILELITRGFKNQEIADHLFISRETVRWHIRGLYSKIGVRPRSRSRMHKDPKSQR